MTPFELSPESRVPGIPDGEAAELKKAIGLYQ
jgi:hypothetical protein